MELPVIIIKMKEIGYQGKKCRQRSERILFHSRGTDRLIHLRGLPLTTIKDEMYVCVERGEWGGSGAGGGGESGIFEIDKKKRKLATYTHVDTTFGELKYFF